MAGTSFLDLMREAMGPLLAWAMAAARMFGIIAVSPVFTRLGLTGLLRGGAALALALPAVPMLRPAIEAAPAIGGAALTFLLAKEAMVGLLIGTILAVPFWAAETAGELIDQQRGSEAATIPDASQAGEAGIMGTLLVLSLAVIFFTGGGLRLLLDAAWESWRIWPALDPLPRLSAEAGLHAIGLLDRMLRLGLVIAGPVLVALLLAEFSLALIGRFAPALNVFDLAMAVKGIVFVLAMPVYALFLAGYLRDLVVPLGGGAALLSPFAP